MVSTLECDLFRYASKLSILLSIAYLQFSSIGNNFLNAFLVIDLVVRKIGPIKSRSCDRVDRRVRTWEK